MPDKTLSERLHAGPGKNISVINPPEGIPGTGKKGAPAPGGLLLFVRSLDELNKRIKTLAKSAKHPEPFWISYPKKSSGIVSDLGRAVCYRAMKQSGFTAVSQISVNAEWSAMRFKPVGSVKSRIFRSVLVDSAKRTVALPEDLGLRLRKKKKAFDFFNSLSFTHRKEYVVWIESAKRPETRSARINKTLQMLSEGIKGR